MRFQYLLVGLVLVVAGCGGSKVAPVSGRVLLDGKPLAGASVNFLPDTKEKEPGPGSVGKTDADGKFTLQLQTGSGNGAIIGKHRVRITAFEGGDEPPSSNPNEQFFRKPLVPERYSGNNTELTFEVPAGGTTEAIFELKSDAPKGK